MINLIQPITVQQAYDGITHARHEIGNGGRLMMTMAMDSPLRSPDGLQISHPEED